MSSVRGWLPRPSNHSHVVEYDANFTVPHDFGNPGAILITNLHGKEFYMLEIVIHGFDGGPVFFPANSWIHSRKDNSESRIFFKNQVRTDYNSGSFTFLSSKHFLRAKYYII